MNLNDEYKMLREEIIANHKQMNQYFTLVCTSALAILAYIFNNPNNPNIFIGIFVMLVCIAARIKRLLEGNVSISTYMEEFLEPYIDARNWEARTHCSVRGDNVHDINKRSLFMNILIFRTNSPYFLLGIIMYFLYIVVLIQNLSLFNLLSGGIFNTVALLVLLYIASFDANNKGRDKYINFWKEVKNKERAV